MATASYQPHLTAAERERREAFCEFRKSEPYPYPLINLGFNAAQRQEQRRASEAEIARLRIAGGW